MPVKPKNDPMAARLLKCRLGLNETQEQFAKRFGVGRTTYLAWERYGPPVHGPIRLAMAVLLRKAQKHNDKVRARKKAKDARVNAAVDGAAGG